jgi:hypothetical protein
MAGGYWNPIKKACQLNFQKVLDLGLERWLLVEELGF